MKEKLKKAVERKEDLQDTLKKCSACEETYLASTSKDSRFGAFQNKSGWYYYAWCKECFAEKNRARSKGKTSDEIKEHQKEKRALERENREWSIYKITYDLTSIEDKLEERFKRWHKKYKYIGVTKREPQHRWNEHLYNLRKGNHHNEAMQMMYNKVKKIYPNLSEEEYENILLNDIITFEVIDTLDHNMSFSEAKLWERIEVKRLEHEILQQIKNKQYDFYINSYELMHLKDDMIVNKEHCNSTERALKEHKKILLKLREQKYL